ncbi:hypothetical protein RI367_004957 [Sorochytrium milnesiophthora]
MNQFVAFLLAALALAQQLHVSVVSVYAAVAIALLVTLVAIGCGIYCWRRRAKMAVLLQKTAYDRGMSQMVQRFKTKYETGNSRSWFKI